MRQRQRDREREKRNIIRLIMLNRSMTWSITVGKIGRTMPGPVLCSRFISKWIYMLFNHQTSFFPRAMIIKITLGKSLVFFSSFELVFSQNLSWCFFFCVHTITHIYTQRIRFRHTCFFRSQCQTLTLIVFVFV